MYMLSNSSVSKVGIHEATSGPCHMQLIWVKVLQFFSLLIVYLYSFELHVTSRQKLARVC